MKQEIFLILWLNGKVTELMDSSNSGRIYTRKSESFMRFHSNDQYLDVYAIISPEEQVNYHFNENKKKWEILAKI